MTPPPSPNPEVGADKPRTAPIDGGRARIPWEIHERAAKQYNDLGYGQSAERLAERGGFGWFELAVLLAGGDPFRGKSDDPRTWEKR